MSGRRAGYPLPSNAEPHGAVIGDDGALWLSDYSNSSLIRVNSAGTMTMYPVGSGVFPFGLVNGAGKLWFVEHLTKSIGSMTLDGSVTTNPVPFSDVLGGPMARDDDGTIWIGGRAGTGTVGQLSPDGSFHLSNTGGQLGQLSPCPDGGVAYSSYSGFGISRDPWLVHIGMINLNGRSTHIDYQVPPSPPAEPQPGINHDRSVGAIVGPPPPPGVLFFGCTKDGAWFVVDRKVVGHVDGGGHGQYFPADSLKQAPAGYNPSGAKTAWVVLGDHVIELSY